MAKKKKGVEFSDMSGWQKAVHVMGYIGVVGVGMNIVIIALGGAMIGGAMLNNGNNKNTDNLEGKF